MLKYLILLSLLENIDTIYIYLLIKKNKNVIIELNNNGLKNLAYKYINQEFKIVF